MTDIIKPLAPIDGRGWQEMPPIPAWITPGFAWKAYRHPGAGIGVISALEVAKDADGIDRGPEYHLSISRYGERCSSADARKVLTDFGMDGAEEDNHVPGGKVRNFWRPVADRFVGMECACKDNEPAIVEDKGDYVWRGVTHS